MPGLWDLINGTAPNANRVAQAMRPQPGQGVPVQAGAQLQMPAGTFDPLTGQTAGGAPPMGLGQAAATNPNIAAAMGNTVGGLVGGRPSMGAMGPQPMLGNMGGGPMMGPQMGGMGQMDPNIAAMMQQRMAQLGGAGGMQGGPAALPQMQALAQQARLAQAMQGGMGPQMQGMTPPPGRMSNFKMNPMMDPAYARGAPAVMGERFGMGQPMDAMAARNLALRLQGGMGAPKMGGASPYMGGAVSRRSAAGPRY